MMIPALAMMYGPTYVLDHEKEAAGKQMTFFMYSGIVLGSLFGLLLGSIVV